MKRIEALDFTRVIAMLSVIVIHVTSTFIYNQSKFMVLGMNLAFILNQLTRYAVPLFILISGMSMRLSEKTDSTISFWKRRALKVGVPYLIWCFIYELYHCDFNIRLYMKVISEDPGDLVRSILLGQAAPHLYFIIILIQLYLLYPVIKRAVNKSTITSIGVSLLMTYLIQRLYQFKSQGLDFIPACIEPYLWLLFPTWIFYFVLGTALSAEAIEQIYKFSSHNTGLLIGITVTYSMLFVIDAQLTKALDSLKQSLSLYVILVLLCAFGIWGKIGNLRFLQTMTRFLSDRSMSIYFCHVLVLEHFRKFSYFASGMVGMIALFGVVLVVSVVIGLAIDIGATLVARKVKCWIN